LIEAYGSAVVKSVQVKGPRRLESRVPVHDVPTERAPTLPFRLTVLTLPVLFTLREPTLAFLLTPTVTSVSPGATAVRLCRLLRTLLDFLSGGGIVITRSPGIGAEIGGKSNSKGSASGNRDILGAGGHIDTALPDS